MDVKENDFVALEVSSFQLDLIEKFKPEVAMILNITPDHLNRYDDDLEKYADSKQQIYKNQDENDYLILNGSNEAVLKYLKDHRSKSFFFSQNAEQNHGCYVEKEDVIFRLAGTGKIQM